MLINRQPDIYTRGLDVLVSHSLTYVPHADGRYNQAVAGQLTRALLKLQHFVGKICKFITEKAEIYIFK